MGVISGAIPAWADKFSGNGNGYGSGSGSGSGYGSGSGSGSGYGDGDGSGYGSGDGDGYGSGDGDGAGSGSGDGYGDGSGYGDGYGSGYGDGYWKMVADSAIARWSEHQRQRFADLAEMGAFLAFWKSAADGTPANGGCEAAPASPGVVQIVRGPLKLCTANALHATLNPDKWKGERLWIVALIGDVAIEDNKVGALQREIIGEVA